MAKFFVGQRVRIIRVYEAKEALGKEATLIKWHESNCWEASVDGLGEWNNGKWYGFDEDQLEPIIYDGAEPLGYSFEQMMSEFGVEEAVK